IVHYSLDPENPTKSCKSRSLNIPVHFKNTPETAQAIRNMHIWKAPKYLKDITAEAVCTTPWVQWWHWEVCPGQTEGWTQSRWAKKSAEFYCT
ncbi:unnamed protein product, partial [Gulo gulo]